MIRKKIKSKFQREQKFEKNVEWVIRFLLVCSMIVSIITANWFDLFIGVITLMLTFLPFVIAKRNHIVLPPSYQIFILLFIFAANFLGELGEFYHVFWWWDIMLHSLSAMGLGLLGFLLIYILNREKRVNVILSPLFMALFSFVFALAVGAIWEIFEFFMDTFFGMNMQKSGLIDTMGDLIIDTIGALAASFGGYFYEKKNGKLLFTKLVNDFISLNSQLFDGRKRIKDNAEEKVEEKV